MVRTTNTHHRHRELEDDEVEDLAAGPDASSQREGKSTEHKAINPRSKHSETEQRRRSKINERFQLLRDLIPPNDQKRDKASLLLEVIEYIQYLQDKLLMYEGSYQGWSQEPTKLIPWRSCHGPVENLIDHSQAMKNGSGSDVSEDAAYRGAEHPIGSAMSAVPLNMPFYPSMFPSTRSILPSENLASQPPIQAWQGATSILESAVTGNAPNEASTSNISSVYSQGLLKNLTQAFRTSGVDLSRTSISVQLDIGRITNIKYDCCSLHSRGSWEGNPK
ncbi:hypothetical protein Nepgr_029089 [Nepenthes gracilis]|uniref:BHLH domain-containing protein n=1 Tax=Nepenthes gracilis TaxID=150966 RepID=A0AAD3TE68_NEPGR|nr:hypothetical protein Nepgr_029089 [Nepenthes gracilis]